MSALSNPTLDVLYEDNHLLAVIKPAGLVTMGVAPDRPSLLAQARQYIKQRYHKPGNVYLGAMSRLDAPVSGVILFARTSKAAARLTAQFAGRDVEKTYWAVVEGRLDPPAGQLLDWLAPDERHRRMHVVGPQAAGAKQARLSYRTLEESPRGSLLEIRLETGRKHQIRVQFSSCGHPVLGDRKYGSTQPFPDGIALHARRLTFEHPVKRGTRIELTAPLPPAWKSLAMQQTR
jgi:23S rRNA pseudouridine1911/1915/1917 synthase